MIPEADSGNSVRPLTYWLERYPPGWVSRQPAATADPLLITSEIQAKLTDFAHWLGANAESRCDTYSLQTLSAALFNRYSDGQGQFRQLLSADAAGEPPLDWPRGSEGIQACLAELRAALQAPFAAFKALRLATTTKDAPTPDELHLAEVTLLTRRAQILTLAATLDNELTRYRAADALRARLSEKPAHNAFATKTQPQHSLAK